MTGAIVEDSPEVGESVYKALESLHPVTRRRLWTDQACEVAMLAGPTCNPEVVASNFRQKQPCDLPNYMYLQAVALSVENALETHVENIAPDQIEEIATEYSEVVEDAQIRFSEGKWREAMCSLNSNRNIAAEYLGHTYDCSASGWVDTCEVIWREDLDTVLSYVNPEYVNSLVAERCATGKTVEHQGQELANTFRAVVAGGNVRYIQHDLALQWAGAHIENINQSGIESFV